MLRKFIHKFANHFSKSKAACLRTFLNTFQTIMSYHINSYSDEKLLKFFSDNKIFDEFTIHTLYKAFDIFLLNSKFYLKIISFLIKDKLNCIKSIE